MALAALSDNLTICCSFVFELLVTQIQTFGITKRQTKLFGRTQKKVMHSALSSAHLLGDFLELILYLTPACKFGIC